MIVVAVAFSFYTYHGSVINAHPSDGLDDAPGSEDPSEPSGRGRTPEEHPDEFGAGGGFSTHGTKLRPATRHLRAWLFGIVGMKAELRKPLGVVPVAAVTNAN